MNIARLALFVLALASVMASDRAAHAGSRAEDCASACGGALPVSAAAQSIGVATMSEDLVIILRLRAEGPGGTIGEGVLGYAPGDPMYEEVKRHIGGIEPGETKPVAPWP